MHNYFTQSSVSQKISRFSASLFLAAIIGVLAGCSGGADAPPAVPAPPPDVNAPPPIPPVASLQLLVSSPQMPSSGANPVDLTAIVLSPTKQTMSGKTVTFSTGSDSTAFVNNISASGVSDANGLVIAKLNLGGNKLNRTITVTATAETTTATNSVDVTGTTITVSGSSSLAFDATAPLAFSVKDSAGAALPNMKVDVISNKGNAIVLTPSSGVTNSAGIVTASVKISNVGNDTITATITATNIGADTVTAPPPNASVSHELTVSSASFAFTAPTTATEIPLAPAAGSAPTVTVNWTDLAADPKDKIVTFSTTRGTIAGGTVTSNSSKVVSTGNATGDASLTVSSATAGPAIITASGPGGTPSAFRDVVFVATSANDVTVQADPGVIQVTTGVASQTSNSSKISVLVRDESNNLVKNAGVNFTVTADSSGGSLGSATAITDVNGSASVTYYAGRNSSAANGVKIQATVTDIKGAPLPTLVTNNTALTVAGQSLLVRLGTDNLVAESPPVNIKTYAAVVTDAAGNAVAGNEVRFALRPGRYWKGYYAFDTIRDVWAQVITSNPCPNEDLNFNGILDVPPVVAVDEDNRLKLGNNIGNANGRLDPGNVATVTATGITDASGIAKAIITYPKDHSWWVEQILEARTGVIGNDPPAVVTFALPGLARDYLVASVIPPGLISPFGIGDPNANIFTTPPVLPRPAVVTCSDTN